MHGSFDWLLPAAIDGGQSAVQAVTDMERLQRSRPAIRGMGSSARTAAALVFMASSLSHAQALRPSEALHRYLARPNQQTACCDSLYAVRIDASMPALKKHGGMTGFKRIAPPGQVVYQSLRFTGDKLVKTQLIARFLARDTNPPAQAADIAVTPANYIFEFDRVAHYNGLAAYVFLLKPRRKRAGLVRGELWLEADTATPLRVWGDLVKSPSIFVRSFRFVQDYQTVQGCTEPLRLLLTGRTRIVGAVEMTVWLHPASEVPEATTSTDGSPDFSMEANRHNEHHNR